MAFISPGAPLGAKLWMFFVLGNFMFARGARPSREWMMLDTEKAEINVLKERPGQNRDGEAQRFVCQRDFKHCFHTDERKGAEKDQTLQLF